MKDRNEILRLPCVITAPLAGITDIAFQKILYEEKAPFISTEMHSAISLIKNPKWALKRLQIDSKVHPISIQLFGNNAIYLSEAAKIVADIGFDVVDINMGCPAKKIVKSGSGIALMRNLPLAVNVMKTVRKAVNIPVSLKLRLGYSPQEKNVMVFAKSAENEGINFITVHGRFRSTYAQPADWYAIGEVKQSVTIPVVGNGDVFSASDASKMIDITGCDSVMIGRCIMGNPWVPHQIQQYIENAIKPKGITIKRRFDVLLRHLELQCKYLGKQLGPIVFRKHAAWYMKGLPEATMLRKNLETFDSQERYRDFVSRYLEKHQSYQND